MKATFAAGCFWGVQFKFDQLPGVISTKVGYSGGHTVNPNYEQVCRGDTGHAESIEIEFDPEQISYQQLLEFFWNIHNPTTLNRQGPDVGHQYRSAVFYHDPDQRHQASAMKSLLELPGSKWYPSEITTEITAATNFYCAEEYHQKYLAKNGLNYC